MENKINVYQPANDAEAMALETLLLEHSIDADVVSFHDTAYDGLYQSQYGWGIIRVFQSDFDKAKKIIQEWQDATPEKLPWSEQE